MFIFHMNYKNITEGKKKKNQNTKKITSKQSETIIQTINTLNLSKQAYSIYQNEKASFILTCL